MRPFVDATLTNTDAGRDALVGRDGLRPERVVVLENGVDTARFKQFMLPDTSKKLVRVGCVANLRPVKNIDGLMRAAKRTLDQFPQLVFEVAGDGDQRDELERLRTAARSGRPVRASRVRVGRAGISFAGSMWPFCRRTPRGCRTPFWSTWRPGAR